MRGHWLVLFALAATALPLQLFAEARDERVLVATRTIRRGDAVRHDAVAVRPVEGRIPADALRDPSALGGLRARSQIRAGSVLRASRLEAQTAIRRGQRVKLIYQSAHLRVEAIGRARHDGNVGDVVEVENATSRRRVVGRVTSSGVVRVGW